MSKLECSVDGCQKTSWARGLCGAHYQQRKDTWTVAACSVGDCENKVYAKQLCQKHYNRFRINGTVELKPPKTILFIQEAIQSQTDKCILWPFTCSDTGYGSVRIDGECWNAHRRAFVLATGSNPAALWCLHKCGVRACINPRHLYWGTAYQNAMDVEDQRGKFCNAKLTHDDVQWIRDNQNKLTRRYMANVLNVEPNTISAVLARKTWKHVY